VEENFLHFQRNRRLFFFLKVIYSSEEWGVGFRGRGISRTCSQSVYRQRVRVSANSCQYVTSVNSPSYHGVLSPFLQKRTENVPSGDFQFEIMPKIFEFCQSSGKPPPFQLSDYKKYSRTCVLMPCLFLCFTRHTELSTMVILSLLSFFFEKLSKTLKLLLV
jgi:hypothetical protein